MPTERLFLDIRHYESDHANVVGTSTPHEIGRIYLLPETIHPLGARIARKLREYGFVAGVFDHLYVNYTTVLPHGEMAYSPRDVDKRIKYVDFGLSPEKTNRLSDCEKESLVGLTTFDILKFVVGKRSDMLALVDRVSTEIKEKGTKLEIVHKTKQTTAYAVTVTYQICPHGNESIGLIEYHDKKSNQRWKSDFVNLRFYEDIFALVGTISVSQGNITLRPRPSFKASLYTKTYKVPIEIPISELKPV